MFTASRFLDRLHSRSTETTETDILSQERSGTVCLLLEFDFFTRIPANSLYCMCVMLMVLLYLHSIPIHCF